MFDVVFSRRAKQDLVDIAGYLFPRNEKACAEISRTIYQKTHSLKEFPLMGTEQNNYSPGIRMLIIDNYVAFYRIKNQSCIVARVLHGARYLPELL